MSSNRKGWRLLKGSNSHLPRGSRLMRDPDDESRSFQVWEGVEGWKQGLTLIRTWRDEIVDGAHIRSFTFIALNPQDLPITAAKGGDDPSAWKNILAALRLAGIMPQGETI